MKILKNKSLDLSYKQFSIFNKDLINPFNDWNEIQVEQGFSYRKESVSIMTINELGKIEFEILKKDLVLEEAKRILEFDFTVTNKYIEIATITEGFFIKLKNKNYRVRIQLCKKEENVDFCYISFFEKENDNQNPRYIKYDEEIKKIENFDLNAHAAI